VYVQTRQVGAADVMAAVAVGLLVDAILVANNLRDLEPDRQSGKRTLAVRVGAAATRRQYAAWMLLPYGLPLGLRLAGTAGGLYWLPWLSLPLALALVRAVVLSREPRALNPLLARTAWLQLLFGALFAAGQLL
jgi:1,4-dihydroxy-2-naphthoate octaprenyltransferase